MNKYSVLNENPFGRQKDFAKMTGAERQTYKKNDIIMQFDDKRSDIGLMETGLSYLVGINAAGEKNILDYHCRYRINGM